MLLLAAALLLPAPSDAVLGGLDPVELCAGRETPGLPTDTLERDGRLYQFATPQTRATFESDPERYAVQLGGGCGRMGPLSGSCSGDRFVVHEGRIFLFASDQCRASFVKAPERFLQADDPALAADEAAVARGKELLARVLEGLGGAARVDAVRVLRVEDRGTDTSDGKSHATRDTRTFRLPDDLHRETAWDEWIYAYAVTFKDAWSGGKNVDAMTPAAVRELRRQMGREPLWLLRHRERKGFAVAADGTEKVGETSTERLRVHYDGATSTWNVDPATGRILRAAWRGRLDTGPVGEIVLDRTDFREVGGLLLPHDGELRFDGQRVDEGSGPRALVEVDPELPVELFDRKV